MDSIMQEVVKFVLETRSTDLPKEVVCETKRVLLDSIGCALCGLWIDRGKISVELARRLGGKPESSIIGTGDKVSCTVAAFANGELINAQDYDAILGNHIPPNVIPAALALAESTRASGEQLILAIGLGHEIAMRLMSALSGWWEAVPDEAARPGTARLKWPPVHGFSSTIFGATSGAGKILGLNFEEMANAMGIAGYICAPSTMRKWAHTTPVRMVKYGPPGWTAQAGCTAALLAQMGYTGDTNVFDSEFGFWRFIGSEKWKPELILEGLGKKWRSLEVSYKQYPAGWCLGGQLDLFTQILQENNLKPEDIEMVHVRPTPVAHFAAWKENKLTTQEDAQFNLPYRIACIAYGIKNTDLMNQDARENPRIREFMKKVKASVDDPGYLDFERTFATLMSKNPVSKLSEVEVVVKGGKSLKKQAKYRKGSWSPEEFRAKDEELFQKFINNAKLVLPTRKIEKTRQIVYELEKFEDVAELMKMVVV